MTKSTAIRVSRKTDLPDWAVEEFRELAEIEPQLYPTRRLCKSVQVLRYPVRRDLGDLYASCLEQLSDFAPDIIILVPGGDDLGVLHHVQAGISEGKRVLVISTEDAESPWRTRIPPTARFLELGRLGSQLSENQRLSVLLRLVLQQKALVIHIINSRLGWEMVRRYGKSLLAVEKRVYASIFADGFNESGGRSGFAIDYLIDCWPFLQAVICDSAWYRKDLIAQYGCQQEKVFTAYFPTTMEEAPVFSSPSSPRVLWAGRFAIEKRLDLLIEIARLSPELPFDVYGYAVDDYGRAMEERMLELPNVTVHGAYDSLKSRCCHECLFVARLYIQIRRFTQFAVGSDGCRTACGCVSCGRRSRVHHGRDRIPGAGCQRTSCLSGTDSGSDSRF